MSTLAHAKLVNSYVRLLKAKHKPARKIAKIAPALTAEQKEQKKQIKGLKANLLKIMQEENTTALASSTNILARKVVDVEAFVRILLEGNSPAHMHMRKTFGMRHFNS